MANVNINRTTTDTNDNVRYSYNAHGNLDYKGITILIIGILAALTIIWLVALSAAAIGCWYTQVYECKETKVIFWGYVYFIAALFVMGLTYVGVDTWNTYYNKQYLEWRGVITHRNDIRGDRIDKVIAVAQISAKSEATAGMDNYSPSITKTEKSSNEDTNAGAGDSIDVGIIGLGEL